MPFKKGDDPNRARGGRREGAGRKPKYYPVVKKNAEEIAREFIENNIQPVLDNYFKLAKGYYETRYSLSGNEYEVFIPDGPTTRHFVDKILPEINDKKLSGPIAIQIIVESKPREIDINSESPRNGRAIYVGGD